MSPFRLARVSIFSIKENSIDLYSEEKRYVVFGCIDLFILYFFLNFVVIVSCKIFMLIFCNYIIYVNFTWYSSRLFFTNPCMSKNYFILGDICFLN